MIGGRGLPTNLNAIQATSDGIKVRKLDAPVDDLLAELENPKSVKIEAAQQSIVEKVEAGDREKLIGQKDRLKRLVGDSRPEVRRTAIWALGRCATVHDALVLVHALDDRDPSVVAEANNALCWLSRRPNGVGLPADPVAELPETASDRQKQAAFEKWQAQLHKEWWTWYDRVRSYTERDMPRNLP
jgi:HEAT repeat protein